MPIFPPTLPIEIWELIYYNIPDAERQELYKVNHALFNISLRDKYKTILFADAAAIPNMMRSILSVRLRRQHVRVLHLWTCESTTPLYNDSFELITQKMKSYTAKRGKQMRQTLSALPDIREVEMKINRYHLFDAAFLPPVVKGLASLKETLVRLKLNLPVEALRLPVLPSLVFPNLQELDIVISRLYLTTDESSIYRGSIVPFVNSHRKTLRSLALLISTKTDATFKCWLSTISLFPEITDLPHLKELRIAYDYKDEVRTPTMPVKELLDRQAKTLETLTLYIRAPLSAPRHATLEPELEFCFGCLREMHYYMYLPYVKTIHVDVLGNIETSLSSSEP